MELDPNELLHLLDMAEAAPDPEIGVLLARADVAIAASNGAPCTRAQQIRAWCERSRAHWGNHDLGAGSFLGLQPLNPASGSG